MSRKRLIFNVLRAIGVTRLASWWNRRRVVILCYHGITKRREPRPADRNGEDVDREQFIAHLDYLRRTRNVIGLDEYLAARRNGHSPPEYSVILTFDDAARNFLTVAAPLLAERGLKAAVYVVTDWTDSRGEPASDSEWSLPDDDVVCSWMEMQRLARQKGIEVGSHSLSHPDMTALDPASSERELRESQMVIKDRLGNEERSFAYPKGRFSLQVAEQARRVGYTCALTLEPGDNDMTTDLFVLRRTLISGRDDIASLEARVSGVASLLRRLGALVRSSGRT